MFDESQVTGTVELVTDSTFEVAQVSIQGFPRQILDGDPNRFPSVVVPGPSFPGIGEVNSLHCVYSSHWTLEIYLFLSDVHTFMSLSIIPFI